MSVARGIHCAIIGDLEKNPDFTSFSSFSLKDRPRGYKTFLCSTQLSMKIILLINVKMPTIVGILTFISRINTSYESLKARKPRLFQRFSFYEQLKFYAQLSRA